MSNQEVVALADFQQDVSMSVFVEMFGGSLGEHLWGRFQDCQSNLLVLINQMDRRNVETLLAHVCKDVAK